MWTSCFHFSHGIKHLRDVSSRLPFAFYLFQYSIRASVRIPDRSGAIRLARGFESWINPCKFRQYIFPIYMAPYMSLALFIWEYDCIWRILASKFMSQVNLHFQALRNPCKPRLYIFPTYMPGYTGLVLFIWEYVCIWRILASTFMSHVSMHLQGTTKESLSP